jgi:hypothetical protein
LLARLSNPQGSKLRINDAEAARVRAIFALYLEYRALGSHFSGHR